jgi:hypothetical protein
LGTWELDGNTLGTRGKKTKTPCPHPPLKKKEKNWINHECMLSLPIGCMKFLFSKLFVWPFLAWANGRGRNLGTEWELIGNEKGTCCEQRKNEKNPPAPKNLKEK